MESYRLNQSAKQMLTGLREGRSRAAALKNSVIVCSDRDSSGATVSETACVTNAIPSATAADFIAENRVVLVQISQGVDVSGAEEYVFNPTGSVRTAGSTEFCLAGKEREIRVAVLGAVDMREGTC
ncbi:type 4 fimbrial biogenesis protein (FimU) [Acinetobacter sp. A3.8]|uniref:Type 4 fimbrial biogenesis protein (FimU) n=1 Tax=Acinetobacter sedimenti TaxID=2919922 RepID=A0A9X2B5Y1_9GAMM|nr:GspH/FimT family pseudopilin [Acinetobacter sedimenti]MCJ8146108.1 type 4 fimbrial biogenesis protein (FimU) [Acinetobacter sedimenti]